MNIFTNENILKLIFLNYIFLVGEFIFNRLKNNLITEIMLRTGNYKNIYKSLGKSNNILYNDQHHTISSLALLSSRNMATVSQQGALMIWDMKTLQCIKSINCDHIINSVISLPNHKIATCEDYKIHIWDGQNDFARIKTVNFDEEYKDFYNLLLLSNNYLALSARSPMSHCIIILDCNKDYKCIQILHEHIDIIESLINLSDNLFSSGSFDCCVKIYSNSDFKLIKKLETEGCVSDLLFYDKNKLVICCTSSLEVWNIDEWYCVKVFAVRECHSRLLLLPYGFIVSCSYSGLIKIWDMRSFETINAFELGEKTSALLVLKDNRIVSCQLNGKIIIYNY
jgi:WD40 repeat protein